MKVLGIESSCDETAAAVVQDGTKLLSNVVATQIDIHKKYGGVVPEIAARSHIEAILPVVEEAIEKAKCSWDDIDAIGVTFGPGLSGSLLIGSLTARTLALIKNKPLYPVNHVEAHVYANFLIEPQPQFPLLALIVSGGHTQLALFTDHDKFKLLGQTQDDAVGEAFDKVAKVLGLPYPGGPSVAKAAEHGDPARYILPNAQLQNPYDFSFSGLKTAVLRLVQQIAGVGYDFPSFKLSELLNEQLVNDVAASFQYRAVKTLVDKTAKAFEEYSPASVVIAGGVAANTELRKQLQAALPVDMNYAPINLCTDNAAMIATLAYYKAQKEDPVSPHKLSINPSLSM